MPSYSPVRHRNHGQVHYIGEPGSVARFQGSTAHQPTIVKPDLFKKGLFVTLSATAAGVMLGMAVTPFVGILSSFVAAGVLWHSISVD